MITKQIAGLLYSHSYQLQDNEGNVWDISELSNSERMILKSTKPKTKGNHLWETIFYSEFGSTYKILAREMEQLTKEIEHAGKKFVPIDYFEISDDDSYVYEFDHGNVKLIKQLNDIAKHGVKWDVKFLPSVVVDQIKEWNFILPDFPEGTTTNLI